jgi:AraC-like DNA-binding protein/quercetin dioxygenase-like cupin family protein
MTALSPSQVGDLADPASFRGMVDMRAGSPVLAGTHSWAGAHLVTPWHVHDLHELICPFSGSLRLRVDYAELFLEPGQAAWIPAGAEHQAVMRQARTVSVFLSSELVTAPGEQVRLVGLTSLEREMASYVARWPIDRSSSDPLADSFFGTLSMLSPQWIAARDPLCLPVSSDPLVQDVMRRTQDAVATARLAEVCRAVGISERSLRRRFLREAGMTWREYLQRCRLLSAAEMLADGQKTVLRIAHDVGFSSVSAFTRRFTQFAGETPSAYRLRRTAAAGDA